MIKNECFRLILTAHSLPYFCAVIRDQTEGYGGHPQENHICLNYAIRGNLYTKASIKPGGGPMDKQELISQIEVLRTRMIRAAADEPLTSPTIQGISQCLDQLLNQYARLFQHHSKTVCQ